MELWIRSQDKSSIVKVDNLYVSVGNYICYYVEKGKEVSGTYYRPSGELGRYETKERALEVLDEIQNILKPIIKIKYEYDDSQPIMNGEWLKSLKEESKIEELSTYVYEMPEN